MSETTYLGLPLIEAAQAQKHVTHNEALLVIDAALQLAVLSRTETAPPASPSAGDRYLVAGPATGTWAGHAGEIAVFLDGAWRFLLPRAGWRLWVAAETAFLVFDGSAWSGLAGGSGISDGDKGDITVSGSGAAWTIDDDAVTNIKLRDSAANSVIGRSAGTAGDPADIVAASTDTALVFSGGSIQFQKISGSQVNGSTLANSKLLTMAAGTLKGNNTGGATNPIDLTATQATAMLDTFTSGAKGLAPASGGGTTNFLRADGSWAAPAGGGGGEANTASNVGTAGVGIFKQKNGTDLEFKKLNAGSGKVTVTDDTGNDEVDIDVAEANLTLGNLGGAIDLGGAKASGTLAAARFPALTGDVTTSAGSLATTIANDAVSNAKLANMATATIKGRATAGTGDPEDLSVTQATALLDTFTSGAKGLAPASGGGTTNFLRADGTWAAPSGGGGSGDVVGPASATDNGVARFDGTTGKLIRDSAVTLDDDGAVTLPAIATPAAPSSGKVTLFGRDVAGRILPAIIGPAGLDTALQPILARNRIAWWIPSGNSTTVNSLGVASSTTGTATARNVATTNFYTQLRRLAYLSAGTAGSSAGIRGSTLQYWRGNGAQLGGFTYIARFAISDASYVSGSRTFAGFTGSTSAIGNVNPSSLTNIIGVGNDATDSNLFIMHNDGSGTATGVDLGANFPSNTTNTDVYELALFCAPNGSDIGYRVERLNTGHVAEGTLSSDLPSSTTLLAHQVWRNNGATATAIGIDIMSVYLETDY